MFPAPSGIYRAAPDRPAAAIKGKETWYHNVKGFFVNDPFRWSVLKGFVFFCVGVYLANQLGEVDPAEAPLQ